ESIERQILVQDQIGIRRGLHPSEARPAALGEIETLGAQQCKVWPFVRPRWNEELVVRSPFRPYLRESLPERRPFRVDAFASERIRIRDASDSFGKGAFVRTKQRHIHFMYNECT